MATDVLHAAARMPWTKPAKVNEAKGFLRARSMSRNASTVERRNGKRTVLAAAGDVATVVAVGVEVVAAETGDRSSHNAESCRFCSCASRSPSNRSILGPQIELILSNCPRFLGDDVCRSILPASSNVSRLGVF